MKTYHYLLNQSPVIDVWLVSSPLLLKSLSNTCLSLCSVAFVRLGPVSLVVQRWGIHLPTQETRIRSLGREDPLEKGMATRSSIRPEESHGQRRLAGPSAGVRVGPAHSRRGRAPVLPPLCASAPLWLGLGIAEFSPATMASALRWGPPTAKVNCWHVVCVAWAKHGPKPQRVYFKFYLSIFGRIGSSLLYASFL